MSFVNQVSYGSSMYLCRGFTRFTDLATNLSSVKTPFVLLCTRAIINAKIKNNVIMKLSTRMEVHPSEFLSMISLP